LWLVVVLEVLHLMAAQEPQVGLEVLEQELDFL
jgi:hypothetical protein